MDLAALTNQPVPVSLAGRTLLVRPRTLRELGHWQAWYKRSVKHPIAAALEGLRAAEAAGVPVTKDLRDAVLAAAQREAQSWPPRIGTYHWYQAIDAVEGGWPAILHLALADTHPELTAADCERLWTEAANDEVWELIGLAIYGETAPASGSAPKAPRATTAAKPAAGASPSASATTGTPSSTGSAPTPSPAASA